MSTKSPPPRVGVEHRERLPLVGRPAEDVAAQAEGEQVGGSEKRPWGRLARGAGEPRLSRRLFAGASEDSAASRAIRPARRGSEPSNGSRGAKIPCFGPVGPCEESSMAQTVRSPLRGSRPRGTSDSVSPSAARGSPSRSRSRPPGRGAEDHRGGRGSLRRRHSRVHRDRREPGERRAAGRGAHDPRRPFGLPDRRAGRKRRRGGSPGRILNVFQPGQRTARGSGRRAT